MPSTFAEATTAAAAAACVHNGQIGTLTAKELLPASSSTAINQIDSANAKAHEGQYVAILEDDDQRCDVSSLAFSPSLKQMFFATKSTGEVFMIERVDGQGFDQPVLSTLYIEEKSFFL